MRKNTETFEDNLKRIQTLAGIKPLQESRVSTPTTILSNTKGKDNVNYAVVKEEGSYYIKTTSSDLINESTLDYIGGIGNKHNYKYKYDSYAHAVRNLNYLMIDLNEDLSYGNTDADIAERLEKDMHAEQVPPPAPGEEGQAPMDQPMPAAEPAPQAPAEQPVAAPVQAAPADTTGLAADDSDLDAPAEDTGSQIDHFVGKLTAEIRDAGPDQLSEDKIKSILNSVIAALPLNQVSPEERLIIARKVKMGDDNGDAEPNPEDVPAEEPAAPEQPAPEMPSPAPEEVDEKITIPVEEIVAPLDAPTDQFKTPHDFDKKDDQKMCEFFANIKNGDFVSENNKIKYKNVLIESVENNLVLLNGDKSFTFNVSESTLGKFKTLLGK